MKPLVNFFSRWNELITLPLAILIFWLMRTPLLALDPTSGLYDAGIFQAFILATAGLLFIHALVWLILKIAANDVYRLLDDFLRKNNSTSLTQWQRALFALFYFWGLLFAWVLLVIALA